MLPINSYTTTEIKTLQKACSYLLTPEQIFDLKFLKKITDFHIKQAYLRQVKYCHPNFSSSDSAERKEKKLDFLKKAHKSYEYLMTLVSSGKPPDISGHNQVKIIAVGGAKGGVGKSMLAANLSVYLTQKGFKTVAMDLDLGGANLALYLGEKFILDRTVNDFLSKKYSSLNDIIIKGKYGPLLIGGDSSELGAANIHYARKMKLLRAIRNLDADFIVLDLGGDTTYNMLDFFLLADYGLVVTTRDSASYIGAYQFLKTAMYRKLNRISGPEADDDRITDKKLAKLIKDATHANGEPIVQSMNELLQRVSNSDPLALPLVLKPIIEFNPYLIINRITKSNQAAQVTQTIVSLSDKTLSVHLESPGYIRKIPEIEDNLRNFAPVVAQTPRGKLATDIGAIVKKIGII